MKLACHCGFSAETPQAFLDHCLETKHIAFPVGDGDDGQIADLLAMLTDLQAAASQPDDATLPDHMEIRPVSREDILADDELTDDQKHDLLTRVDLIEKRRRDGL
jgi:hypothetical protein